MAAKKDATEDESVAETVVASASTPREVRDALVALIRVVRDDVTTPTHTTAKLDAILARFGED